MKTQIIKTDNLAEGGLVYTINFSNVDLATAPFTDFDRALFKDIEEGEPSDCPMADILLGLETMMRRIEQNKVKAAK